MEYHGKAIPLSQRLATVGQLVRVGCVLWDVGTDHAYLPVALVANETAYRAYATDINEGPINRARETVRAYGMEKYIRCIQTDGLDGIEATGADTATICGMGGELIASIIDRAGEALQNEYMQLVLQPMTRWWQLRKYLWDNRFFIERETLCRDEGRIYLCMRVHYSGHATNYTFFDTVMGKYLIDDFHDDLFVEYCKRNINRLENMAKCHDEGKRREYLRTAQQIRELYDWK